MSDTAWSFVFAGRRLLLKSTGDGASVPTSQDVAGLLEALGPNAERFDVVLPALRGRDSRLHAVPDDFEAPDGFELTALRATHALLDKPFFRAAGTARQKIEWVRTHRFCSRCGAPTERGTGHEAMECTTCGQLHFARLTPAIIVLIQRGREALLGRSPHFTPGVYSTLAGFVEPGEFPPGRLRQIEEGVLFLLKPGSPAHQKLPLHAQPTYPAMYHNFSYFVRSIFSSGPEGPCPPVLLINLFLKINF